MKRKTVRERERKRESEKAKEREREIGRRVGLCEKGVAAHKFSPNR